MSLIDIHLPKKYKDGEVLFEETLDAWRKATEAAFALLNLNLQQLAKDLFPSNYDYNNDGNQSLSYYLYELINNVVTGATPITGTSADSFTINTDGNSSTLTTAALTADRTHTLPNKNGTFVMTSDLVGVTGATVPIGSIIAHYDYNALVAIDTDYWRYCDGSVLSYAASPLDGQTLPDLSNRYLVGFGTEAGGDIDTAAWDTSAHGNPSHQINIQHTHGALGVTSSGAGGAHHHTGPNHAHGVPAHYHGMGTGADLSISGGSHKHGLTDDLDMYNNFAIGAGRDVPQLTGQAGTAWSGETNAETHTHASGEFSGRIGLVTGGVSGNTSITTSSEGTGNTGDESAHVHDINHTHAASLLTTQTIQPRSLKVRWAMRVL